MTTETALALGYQVTERDTPRGRRWFTAPKGTPDHTTYGRAFATQADALEEVERRLAYQLKTDVATLRQHLAALLDGPKAVAA